MSDSPNEVSEVFRQAFRSILVLSVIGSVSAAVVLIFALVFRQ
jgi:hypothetical protein